MKYWIDVTGGKGGHYRVHGLCNPVHDGMAALREMFPDAKADEMNFVLFSTSGEHGTYQTIEEEEIAPENEKCGITFVIVQPRRVATFYGVCEPNSKEDYEFLKSLRQSSWDAVLIIGAKE